MEIQSNTFSRGRSTYSMIEFPIDLRRKLLLGIDMHIFSTYFKKMSINIYLCIYILCMFIDLPCIYIHVIYIACIYVYPIISTIKRFTYTRTRKPKYTQTHTHTNLRFYPSLCMHVCMYNIRLYNVCPIQRN